MMAYTRETTLAEVRELSMEQLDFLVHAQANSIGMLLAHMASVEKAYQIDTFEKRDFTEKEIELFGPALNLGKPAQEQIQGNPVEFYLEQLEQTRKKTIEKFQTLEDAWLFEQTPFWWDKPANNYFKWFHVFEDELNHRGQIRLIKKMMEMSNE
ncbi:DinB family protein [Sporosarcina oncorhynchi]|uniref:DinB family protein n=1 Tax=Sporosarcina oncorhynchi TaxID=3056444 RepID=A0ABZ0LAD3_9BACL|nr:DinB family protein [Sporosarcina sp. T2O-4]WOV89267.1 DinB family protein [Sporosarcina sp. T2O-4]